MSFARQFQAGADAAQGILDTYRSSRQRRELEEIGNAKPVQSDDLTAEQSAQVQQAAADPSKHIGYDLSTKAYMATPKLGENEMGPAQPVEIARASQMTELFGKRTPGAMTPEQVSDAKFKAMADVISKGDPIQGMRLQREVKQGEREDKRWMREDRKATEDEDFQKGQQAEFGQTIYGKRMGDYATQVQAFEQYQSRAKAGESPQTLGAPPPTPQRPTYSVAESLADGGRLLAFKASKGKADPAELVQFAEKFQKVADEGYGKALKLAQGGAPLAKVIEQFNQSGGVKLDPAAVVSDQMVNGPDGVPARVITVRGQDGKTQTINALSELDALGQAESYFGRFYKAEDNRRGNNADARSDKQVAEQARHNRASEGISAGNLGIAREEAARRKQVFDQESKLPDPVKRSYAALETQAKAMDSAMYKAMADGNWQPGTPGTAKMEADRVAVSLQMRKLLGPYMPASAAGGGATADPLGLRAAPAEPTASTTGARTQAASPVAPVVTIQQAAAPRPAPPVDTERMATMASARDTPPAPTRAATSPQALGDDFESPGAKQALAARVQQAASGGEPLTRVETLRARQLNML